MGGVFSRKKRQPVTPERDRSEIEEEAPRHIPDNPPRSISVQLNTIAESPATATSSGSPLPSRSVSAFVRSDSSREGPQYCSCPACGSMLVPPSSAAVFRCPRCQQVMRAPAEPQLDSHREQALHWERMLRQTASQHASNASSLVLLALLDSMPRLADGALDVETMARRLHVLERGMSTLRVSRARTAGASDQAVNLLPHRSFSKKLLQGGESDEARKCMICLEDYEEEEVLITLPCIHQFHRECIVTWLKEKAQCPLCKMSLADLIHSSLRPSEEQREEDS